MCYGFFAALFDTGGWKHYPVKSFLFYLAVFGDHASMSPQWLQHYAFMNPVHRYQ